MDGEEKPIGEEKKSSAKIFNVPVHGANTPIIGDGTTVNQNTDNRTVHNIIINVNNAKGMHLLFATIKICVY